MLVYSLSYEHPLFNIQFLPASHLGSLWTIVEFLKSIGYLKVIHEYFFKKRALNSDRNVFTVSEGFWNSVLQYNYFCCNAISYNDVCFQTDFRTLKFFVRNGLQVDIQSNQKHSKLNIVSISIFSGNFYQKSWQRPSSYSCVCQGILFRLRPSKFRLNLRRRNCTLILRTKDHTNFQFNLTSSHRRFNGHYSGVRASARRIHQTRQVSIVH